MTHKIIDYIMKIRLKVEKRKNKEEEKMGVASLVLGILAVLIGIFSSGVLGWLGAIMAIIGVVVVSNKL